jgi:hypothetical protein
VDAWSATPGWRCWKVRLTIFLYFTSVAELCEHVEDEEPGDGEDDDDDDGMQNPLVDALFEEIERLQIQVILFLPSF